MSRSEECREGGEEGEGGGVGVAEGAAVDVEECVGGGVERVGWGRGKVVEVEGVEGGGGGVGDGEVGGVVGHLSGVGGRRRSRFLILFFD